MPVWRNARLRRLYGKPDDPIEAPPTSGAPIGSRTRGIGRTEASPGANAEPADSAAKAPPPPKRIKREKTRPESEYALIHNIPVSAEAPDYSLLSKPASSDETNMIAYAVHASRQNWLAGPMFETFWTRKPRGKKIADGQVNLREKMTKLHECSVTLGPHTFPVRLFTVKDDNAHLDDEADKEIEERLAKEKAATEAPAANGDTTSTEAQGPVSSVGVNVPQTSKTSKPIEPSAPPLQASPSNENGTPPSQKGDPVVGPTHETKEPTYQPAAASIDTNTTEPPAPLSSGDETKRTLSESRSSAPSGSEAPTSSSVDRLEPPVSNNIDQVQSTSSGNLEGEREKLENEKRHNEDLERRLNMPKPLKSPDVNGGNDTAVGSGTEAGSDTIVAPKIESSQPDPPTTGDGSTESVHSTPVTNTTPNAPNAPNLVGAQNQNIAPPQQMQPPPELPRTTPNQLVVFKLQQMAARDPTLSDLMKHVASGSAPPESIAKFQEVINRVKASIFTPPASHSPAHTKRASAPKAKNASHVTRSSSTPSQPKAARPAQAYHPRASAKAIMLAIEFEESPTDRYLLPKRSILEYIPQKKELLWSFLHVQKPQSDDDKEVYTPFTAVFHDIPLRVAQTLERCVRKPEVVAVYMKDTMSRAERSQPWNIWFEIEKGDEVLLDHIKKMPIPYMAPPPPPRKPTKPRKPRGPTPAQIRMQREKMYGSGVSWMPLPVWPHVRLVPGQPLIQAPAFLRRSIGVGNLQRSSTPNQQTPQIMLHDPDSEKSIAATQLPTQENSQSNGTEITESSQPVKSEPNNDDEAAMAVDN